MMQRQRQGQWKHVHQFLGRRLQERLGQEQMEQQEEQEELG